ncbi:MAG TPA: hypothetical protein VNA16_06265, partial [Abditibacteriaceae bacterium]|nr:hypothetical protein [Abditibacteriaceae bacterium]
MAYVAKCTFREHAKSYYLDPGDLEVHAGSKVVAETARGLEIGEVKFLPREVPDTSIIGPVRPIIRLATAADIAREAENRALEERAMRLIKQRI